VRGTARNATCRASVDADDPAGAQAEREDRARDHELSNEYRANIGGGANFEYEVIGWVGFVTTGYDIHGSKSQLFGYFTRVIWQGIQGQTGGSSVDFGVRSVSLSE
jgi:hypothetical protein